MPRVNPPSSPFRGFFGQSVTVWGFFGQSVPLEGGREWAKWERRWEKGGRWWGKWERCWWGSAVRRLPGNDVLENSFRGFFGQSVTVWGFFGQSVTLERVTGIEPAWPAWKAGALPLSYTRRMERRHRIVRRRPSPTPAPPAPQHDSQGPQRPQSGRSSWSGPAPPTLVRLTCAGRSVVASAPALGAGDREFDSPRPDHLTQGDIPK